MRRVTFVFALLFVLAGSAFAGQPPPTAVVALGAGPSAWATSSDPTVQSHLQRLAASEGCRGCVRARSLIRSDFRMADLERQARLGVRIASVRYVTIEPGAGDVCAHTSIRSFEASLARGLAVLTRSGAGSLVLLLSAPRTGCGSPAAYNRALAETCFEYSMCLYDHGALWRLSLGPGPLTQRRIAAVEWPIALRLLIVYYS
jgi:hypothetical protein